MSLEVESEHVVYRGSDGHIHMLLYESSKNQWRHADLNVRASATGFPAQGDPAAYAIEVRENGGFWEDVWNGVKGAWDGVRRGLSALWDLGGWLLTPVGFFVNLILSVPVLGALIRGVLNTITSIVFGIVGFVVEGILCGVFGVCLPKRIRVFVVMFTIEGEPLVTENGLEPLLQRTKQIFKDEANIEILSPFTIYERAEGTRAMDPPCGARGLLEDMVGVPGMQYHNAATFSCMRWGTASIVGIGSPIYAFGVRDVRGKNGCSLGPWSNYVVFEPRPEPPCTTHLAHEIGHTCGLWGLWGHLDDTENLMHEDCVEPRDQLRRWQKAIVRGSKYATYW